MLLAAPRPQGRPNLEPRCGAGPPTLPAAARWPRGGVAASRPSPAEASPACKTFSRCSPACLKGKQQARDGQPEDLEAYPSQGSG